MPVKIMAPRLLKLTPSVAQLTLMVPFLQAREAGKAVQIGRGPATVIG
jgi:hypothetical protein